MKQRQIDDVQFLNNPNKWPFWPYCPVRNNSGISDDFSNNAIVAESNNKLIIAEGFNFFAFADGTQQIKESDWKEMTAEQIVLNGWKVD